MKIAIITGSAGLIESPAVPGPVSGFEPFHPACRQDSGRSRRIFVTDTSLEEIGDRRDP